jgi:hypothetical protein
MKTESKLLAEIFGENQRSGKMSQSALAFKLIKQGRLPSYLTQTWAKANGGRTPLHWKQLGTLFTIFWCLCCFVSIIGFTVGFAYWKPVPQWGLLASMTCCLTGMAFVWVYPSRFNNLANWRSFGDALTKITGLQKPPLTTENFPPTPGAFLLMLDETLVQIAAEKLALEKRGDGRQVRCSDALRDYFDGSKVFGGIKYSTMEYGPYYFRASRLPESATAHLFEEVSSPM